MADFYIVYNKKTEPAAAALQGKLTGKKTCVIWDEKTYKDNRARITNTWKILFLDDKLICNFLPKECIDERVMLLPDIFLIKNGNMFGIPYDPKTRNLYIQDKRIKKTTNKSPEESNDSNLDMNDIFEMFVDPTNKSPEESNDSNLDMDNIFDIFGDLFGGDPTNKSPEESNGSNPDMDNNDEEPHYSPEKAFILAVISLSGANFNLLFPDK